MKKFIAAIVLALGLASAAHADHHGRGKEQLNGFPGLYDLGPAGRATFTHDGILVVSLKSSDAAITVMDYTVKDQVLTVKMVSAPAFFPAEQQQCMKDKPGIYEMVDIENGFTLKVQDDPCAARPMLMQRTPWTDYKRPE
ncbi:MAG: hypothetical protein AAFY19_12725 [Pseudomonadota bacterium]